jgi:lysozyme
VPVTETQLPPVVDLEYVGNSKQRPQKEELQKELKIYIEQVKNQYGKEPILYTTNDFYRDYLYPEMTGYRYWIRNLFVTPKRECLFWQYSQWGKIDGIDGRTDVNFFHGPTSELEILFY